MNDEERGRERPSGYRPGGRYSTFVGLAFLVIVVIATLNTVRSDEGGLLGTGDDERGTPLAEFAVPKLLGPVEGDANVFQDDCESARSPCPEEDRRTPACEVELEQVIRVCDFFDRPLALSFWFTRGADCLPAQDLFDRVARRYRGRVNFLSLNVRDDRDEARRIVTERGWQVPVAYDADGAVSNLYRVGVCPTVAFVYPGGILSEAKIGTEELEEDDLVAAIEALMRESRLRAATDR